MRYLLSFILFFATAAQAELIGPVDADLNGDGLVERFWLDAPDGESADLVIENTGGGVIRAEDIAWAGAIGQRPELGLTEHGSLKIISMNEAIGRNRWHLVLTVAYRDGAYMVAGFTYDHYDTLDLANSGQCDFNLLTGKGIVELDGRPRKRVSSPLRALPVTEWKDDVQVPETCFDR